MISTRRLLHFFNLPLNQQLYILHVVAIKLEAMRIKILMLAFDIVFNKKGNIIEFYTKSILFHLKGKS